MYIVNVYTVPIKRFEFVTQQMADRVADHYERQECDVVIEWRDDDYTVVDRYNYPLT